jgi:hypothetical protein
MATRKPSAAKLVASKQRVAPAAKTGRGTARTRAATARAGTASTQAASQGLRLSLPNGQVITLAPGQQTQVVARAIRVATGRLQLTLPNGRKLSLNKKKS